MAEAGNILQQLLGSSRHTGLPVEIDKRGAAGAQGGCEIVLQACQTSRRPWFAVAASELSENDLCCHSCPRIDALMLPNGERLLLLLLRPLVLLLRGRLRPLLALRVMPLLLLLLHRLWTLPL